MVPEFGEGGTTANEWQFLRDQSSGFSCPICGQSLVPVSTQDRYAFAFGCTAGHVVGLDDLFERQSDALRRCFEAMIGTWEKSIRQMIEGAEIADRNGSADLADRFRRRIHALEARVLLFKETFLKAEPPD